jgi:arsenite-transporting ATPase
MGLLAVDEHARGGAYDLVVVDCAPTDSTLRLATLPDVTHGAVRIALKLQRAVAAVMTPLADGVLAVPLPDASVFGDLEKLIYRTLRRLRVLLSKPTTTVRMVVTPERMVIDEARRAWTELSLFDLAIDGVVLNRVLPQAALEEPFFQDWGRLQRERALEVVEHFDPVCVLEAPLAEDEVVGIDRLARHGAVLFGSLDPASILSEPPRVRFVRAAPGYRVHLPLPGAEPEGLDVAVVAGDLVVRAGARRRAIRLPRRVAACTLDAARLEAGELVVEFAASAPPPVVG